MLRLDYLSCLLTITSTILIGRRKWHGWIIAGVNSAIITVIGIRTSQIGFVPANLFCIAIYGYNLMQWRKPAQTKDSPAPAMSDTLKTEAPMHAPRRFARSLSRAFTAHERPSRNSDRVRQRTLPYRR